MQQPQPICGAPHWVSAGRTDAGMVRTINQDAFLDRPDLGLWGVADGMGGHEDGAFASRAIVEALALLPRPRLLGRAARGVMAALDEVNQCLLDEALRRHAELIGSTVVVLLAVRGHCAVLWSGDSRAYRLRRGVFSQLTRDHSQVQLLVDAGALSPEQAHTHPMGNVLVRAVGSEPNLRLDVHVERICAGDRLLLCSDGLYRELAAAEMRDLLAALEPEPCAEELVRRACAHGGRDNVTAVVVGC